MSGTDQMKMWRVIHKAGGKTDGRELLRVREAQNLRGYTDIEYVGVMVRPCLQQIGGK